MARARITVLAENTVHVPGLGSEHGLSLAIDLGHNILWLLDTGQGELFAANAQALGIDVSRASGLVISHGHYDHAGGLPTLLATGFGGQILAHPGWTQDRYNVKPGKATRFIGVDRASLPHPLPGLTLVDDVHAPAPSLTMVTAIPRLPGNPQNVADFFHDPQGAEPDPVLDDVCLVLDGAAGAVVLLGCCHSGLENTLAHVKSRLAKDRIHAVLGGLHLMNSGPSEVEQAARVFEEYGVERVLPGHCTGSAAIARLRDLLGRKVEPLGSGLVVEFEL